MDQIFELMRRDAIDSGRFLLWLYGKIFRQDRRPCPACDGNPLKACRRCYDEGLTF